jgi:hypothetical protein
MVKLAKVSIAVAVLLAVGGVTYYFAPAPAPAAIARAGTLEDCYKAAQMFYDVKWAAACMAQPAHSPSGAADGHAECDLPDDRAAVINAWLNEAEKRCRVDVLAAARQATETDAASTAGAASSRPTMARAKR